jgi:flagellar basal-body rod modification protein FlgD
MSTIPSSLSALYNNASPSTLPTNQSSADYKTEFLDMLVAQLKNQDPTDPVDDSQMLAQQAQFESLEQMQNLNTNMVTSLVQQSSNQAASMLGRTVTGTVNGAQITGQVNAVTFSNGTPSLQVYVSPTQTVTMQLSDITEIQ